jgi:hypothetical protein
MPKYFVLMIAALCLGFSLAGAVPTRDADWGAQQKQFKIQQKRERNALKMQQKNIKQSWKHSRIPSVTRTASKHQMQRASRDMKQRQKDARQDMKDRHRALVEMQRASGQ